MEIRIVSLGYGLKLVRNEESVFLQGDDAAEIEQVEEDISRIWSRKFGKGYRKAFGPFKSYEEHLTAALDCYFGND